MHLSIVKLGQLPTIYLLPVHQTQENLEERPLEYCLLGLVFLLFHLPATLLEG